MRARCRASRVVAISLLGAVCLAVAAVSGGRSGEAFEDTQLDRLCKVVRGLDLTESVAAACQAHLANAAQDTCLDGCDPVSLCGQPAFAECSRGARLCDVTHLWVGPHLSVYNEDLPRFFRVKVGFCLHVHVGTAEWPVVRVDPVLRDTLMRFPESLRLPWLGSEDLALQAAWSVTTQDRFARLPVADVPPRPASLTRIEADRPRPARMPAFALVQTSRKPGESSTVRALALEDAVAMLRRDSVDRRPASPDRMVATFVCVLRDGLSAHNGHDGYALTGGALVSAVAGDLRVGAPADGVVRVLTSLVVELADGGFVSEVREVISFGGHFRVSCKRVAASARRLLDPGAIAGCACFLGAPDAEGAHAILGVGGA